MIKQQHSSSHLQNIHSFPEIQLHPSISKKQIQNLTSTQTFDSHLLTLILYNYLQTPQLEQFLDIALEAEGQLCLVKKEITTKNYKIQKQDDKVYEYFLLYMVNENTPLEFQSHNNQRSKSVHANNQQIKSLKPILTTLISLCDKIIVFDLDNQKQAFIEKIFFQSITTCQKIKWQNPYSRVQRLVLIRQCYDQQNFTNKKSSSNPNAQKSTHDITNKITLSTSMDTLKYFSSLGQYDQHLTKQKQRYLNLKRQFSMVNDNQFIDALIRAKKVIKKISLQQLLQIYQKIMQIMTTPIEQIVVQSFLNKFHNDKLNENLSQSQKNMNINIKGLLNQQQDHQTFGTINIKQPWKVRYYIQKVYQLESISKLYQTIQKQIFYPDITNRSIQFVHKQILNYLNTCPTVKINQILFNQTSIIHYDYVPEFIGQVSLSQGNRQKLIWKLERLQKFQRQLIQEDKYSPKVSQNKLIYDLSDEEITFWLEKHKDRWLETSMTHLKQYFNKIANQKDHKAIQQFKQQCYKMKQRAKKINTSFYESPKGQIVKYMRNQLQQFIEYHYDVIQQKRFAGIKYFWKQVPFSLKHKQKIRNKIVLFVLIIVLALMQKNVIAGLTIGTMAFIVLAIRL